jgi:IS4 transposase
VKKRVSDEYSDVDLGDKRRGDRLRLLVEALVAEPSRSFPEVLGDGAELEAAYRFLSNDEVTPEGVLSGHHRETAKRCRERKEVVVAHDTTDFAFKGSNRRGLGRLRGSREQGFFAHISLAVSADDWREPLGVLAQETWTRDKALKNKAGREWRRQHEDREPLRWARCVDAVEQLLPGPVIHVMDREADLYDLLVKLVEDQRHFVIRSRHDRKLANKPVAHEPAMLDELRASPIRAQRVVQVAARARALFPDGRKIHPERDARTATLGIRSIEVEIRRPRNVPLHYPAKIRLNIVSADEIRPPAGEAPISWSLWTTESITTVRDLERIIDLYRCRWRIEEYFKALKTGCAIEKRQLESLHALLNALAVYLPIAWRVLRHRTIADTDGNRRAATLLSDLQLRILRSKLGERFPTKPTVADALLAIAAIGGHLRRNGDPGWQTLARGYERLLTLEEGAQLVAEM